MEVSLGKTLENHGKMQENEWENPDLVRLSFVPDGDFMELQGVE